MKRINYTFSTMAFVMLFAAILTAQSEAGPIAITSFADKTPSSTLVFNSGNSHEKSIDLCEIMHRPTLPGFCTLTGVFRTKELGCSY